MTYSAIVDSENTTPLLTVSEAAAFLHVHPNTLRRWNDIGLLVSYRISSRGDRRFLREDLVRFLADYNASQEDS